MPDRRSLGRPETEQLRGVVLFATLSMATLSEIAPSPPSTQFPLTPTCYFRMTTARRLLHPHRCRGSTGSLPKAGSRFWCVSDPARRSQHGPHIPGREHELGTRCNAYPYIAVHPGEK